MKADVAAEFSESGATVGSQERHETATERPTVRVRVRVRVRAR